MKRTATAKKNARTSVEAAGSALANVRRIIHAIHAQSAVIETASGLTGPQLWALREIDRSSPAGISLGEVARLLVLHKATAGRIVERLQALKLVTCERPPDDRRFVVCRATRAGSKLATRPLPGPAQAGLLSRLEALPRARVEAIDRALAEVVHLLGAESVDAGPLFEERRAVAEGRRTGKRRKAGPPRRNAL